MRDLDDERYGDENVTGSVVAGTDCDDLLVQIYPLMQTETGTPFVMTIVMTTIYLPFPVPHKMNPLRTYA